MRSADATQLLREDEYPLASASRYVMLDKQRHALVPIMSDRAPMPQDYLVFPLAGPGDRAPYRFVDEFGVNAGVDAFFRYEVL